MAQRLSEINMIFFDIELEDRFRNFIFLFKSVFKFFEIDYRKVLREVKKSDKIKSVGCFQ